MTYYRHVSQEQDTKRDEDQDDDEDEEDENQDTVQAPSISSSNDDPIVNFEPSDLMKASRYGSTLVPFLTSDEDYCKLHFPSKSSNYIRAIQCYWICS